MSVRKKFQPIDQQTRQAIMDEYLAGGITQKELGEKHNFHYRQLRRWFSIANRLEEYTTISKKNISTSSSVPMTAKSKYKISGRQHIHWKGKKLDITCGIIEGVLIPTPDHPAANNQGYVYEHRLVVEHILGRYLNSDEIVHHIDLDPTNNDPTNLVVLNQSEHGRLHILLQLSLVQLMPSEQLQKLTHYLVDRIRNDEGWKPIGKGNGRQHKRQIRKDKCADES